MATKGGRASLKPLYETDLTLKTASQTFSKPTVQNCPYLSKLVEAARTTNNINVHTPARCLKLSSDTNMYETIL
eukprot:573979-Heterocapsa_arctica.AAC.1